MRPLLLLAASALALTAAACGPKTPVARAALDCPANEGDLTRTAIAPDRKTCTYTNGAGAEVTLQLVSVSGGVDQTLSNIETNLLANRTPPAPDSDKADSGKADSGKDAKDKTKPAKESGKAADKAPVTAADKAAKEAATDATEGVQVEMSKDGKGTVVTHSHDGATRVNLPGIHITANDNDDSAHVQVGPIEFNAGGDTQTLRLRRDVRLRGEALNPQRRGLRATFIYTGKDLPEGYRFVGYEAGGPKAGPLTIAVVKSRSDSPNGDELYPGVKKLVRLNGGV
ncbi:hypothetical protein [Phenylobacterium sp.]|uniref:hypothetical protein n=1 Tax=Phenylobacterium sp. TaxID=1871053 RepID=UPI0025E843C5|nr:hypothetical protein [Phenylobacterium sp.]